MVLDGQCSCSGVNTGSGKEHFTKRKTSKKKKKKTKTRTSTFKWSFQSFLLTKELSALERRTALNYRNSCIWDVWQTKTIPGRQQELQYAE